MIKNNFGMSTRWLIAKWEDARNLPGGVYLCSLHAENFAEIKTIKMLVIK